METIGMIGTMCYFRSSQLSESFGIGDLGLQLQWGAFVVSSSRQKTKVRRMWLNLDCSFTPGLQVYIYIYIYIHMYIPWALKSVDSTYLGLFRVPGSGFGLCVSEKLLPDQARPYRSLTRFRV